jgi:hypothetical protein
VACRHENGCCFLEGRLLQVDAFTAKRYSLLHCTAMYAATVTFCGWWSEAGDMRVPPQQPANAAALSGPTTVGGRQCCAHTPYSTCCLPGSGHCLTVQYFWRGPVPTADLQDKRSTDSSSIRRHLHNKGGSVLNPEGLSRSPDKTLAFVRDKGFMRPCVQGVQLQHHLQLRYNSLMRP